MKSKRIKKNIYRAQNEARSDIFIMSKYFITASVGIIQMLNGYRRNMKNNIVNGPYISV